MRVNCTNSSVTLSGKNVLLKEDLNVSSFITKNRFWYLYRKVKEWAEENFYGKCICAATMRCGNCKDVKKCTLEALKRLQAKFDEFVECKWEGKTSHCCREETGSKCMEPSVCLGWDACPTMSQLQCLEPPLDSSVCLPEKLITLKGHQKERFNLHREKDFPFLTLSNDNKDLLCYSKIWNEWKLAGKDVYVCEDHKYYIPSPKGPIPLKFVIVARASFRVPHPLCERIIECKCPKDAKHCYECIQTGCTPCE